MNIDLTLLSAKMILTLTIMLCNFVISLFLLRDYSQIILSEDGFE